MNGFKSEKEFMEGISIPQYEDILSALSTYDIHPSGTIKLIDSSHDAEDIRLNYIIENRWVLRFCNIFNMTEQRLNDLYRLIERYREAEILCPQFIRNAQGQFLSKWHQMVCYLSEYIDKPIASDETILDEDALVLEVGKSVARFAEKHRNIDLSETMGMYSLFDLCPFDIPIGIDEKEDNFNQLISLLRDIGEDRLVDKLVSKHMNIRKNLKAIYKDLPRCVFQGDENFSNVLIDDKQHFVGFIDFNLSGTEVIVNQLANLAGFDYDEKQEKQEGAQNRLNYALDYFRRHVENMLRSYHASAQELQALCWYAWIVMVAQWPTLCYFRDCINGELKGEILEMLSLIADIPEEQLLSDIWMSI